MAGAVLLHTPPPTVSVNEVVNPVQTIALDGDNAVGVGSTVTALTAAQPAPEVYEILVVPAATLVTLPETSTVATAVLSLLHV
jgi:hypothetical protein